MSVCAACPVNEGECPVCGTFWFRREDGKVFSVRRVDSNPWKGPTGFVPGGLFSLDQLSNVARRNGPGRSRAHSPLPGGTP